MPNIPLNERLEFYGINDIDDKAMAGVSRALDKRIDKALEHYYDKVGGHQELVDHFDGLESMARTRKLQAEHWKAVFRNRVNSSFRERSLHIGKVHSKIGLSPRWYVGALLLSQARCALWHSAARRPLMK